MTRIHCGSERGRGLPAAAAFVRGPRGVHSALPFSLSAVTKHLLRGQAVGTGFWFTLRLQAANTGGTHRPAIV